MISLPRMLRIVAVVWAVAAVIGMGQAVRPSIDGDSMLVAWIRSLGWLLDIPWYRTGDESPEALRALAVRSALQFVFYFGWVPALWATRPGQAPSRGGAPLNGR